MTCNDVHDAIEPIAAGDIATVPGTPHIAWQGRVFKIYQDTAATVERVFGEFYWKVAVGEKVRAVDYIAPPEGITGEFSGEGRAVEVNYSHGTYLPIADVEKAFGVTGLAQPTEIGWLQPNPYGEGFVGLWWRFAVALIVIAIAIGIARSGSEAFPMFPPEWAGSIGSLTTSP